MSVFCKADIIKEGAVMYTKMNMNGSRFSFFIFPKKAPTAIIRNTGRTTCRMFIKIKEKRIYLKVFKKKKKEINYSLPNRLDVSIL